MDHFWETIPGTFTFPEFYKHLVYSLLRPRGRLENARIVEVGVHYGQSAAFLAVELSNAYQGDAPPRLDLVDASLDRVGDRLDRVQHMIGQRHNMLSWQAADRYGDGSLDAVFIDADHAYDSVKADIAAWWPKVRLGGILAGHDFTLEIPGVIQAVVESIPAFNVMRCSPWRNGRIVGEGQGGNYYPVWWLINDGERKGSREGLIR